jgi:hypothetical protein
VSSPRVALTPADAIREIAWLAGYSREGEFPIYVNGKPNAAQRLPCRDVLRAGERLGRIAAALDMDQSAEVAVGLPRIAEFVYSTTLLHAWTTTGDAEKRAARFNPLPSIVLKVGGSKERLLMWVLRNPISEEKARILNARIAYCLGAPRTRSKPEQLRIPLPGTFARVGRSRPAPILLTRLHVERGHLAEKVAGGLREPPDPEAWRERK